MRLQRRNMRCLLLHREDDHLAGAWAQGPWDRVFDLATAGSSTYDKWRKGLGCEVEPRPSLDRRDFELLRQMHTFGLGQVVDEQGLDWWSLSCVRWLDQFVDLVLMVKLVASVGSSDEIWIGSPPYAELLEAIAPGRVRRISAPGGRRRRSRLGRLRGLNFRQVLEVLGDKYDGGYRYRRWIAPFKANCRRPVVLLPSAYGNASKTAFSLAASLPDHEFLLVATRRSAWLSPVPPNTKRGWLSSYAAGKADQREVEKLLRRWEGLRRAFSRHAELALLSGMGCFDKFPAYLREGLAIRNCWVNVLAKEPIVSVLCADEKNPYTRIPVLLAQKQRTATVACHHGALDGRYLFSDIGADQFLAKSEMEWDYMVRTCKVPEEAVRFDSALRTPIQAMYGRNNRNTIVFFSEPYEALSCRAREVYAEVLPALATIAREYASELVIKLHPFESLRERKQLVARVLSNEDREVVRFGSGPITNELMENAWFSVTVSSSAVVDFAARGIPAFLCLWLDRYGFGYGEQFVKFGAAIPLWAEGDIATIPKVLGNYAGPRVENCSPNVQPELLRELLFPNAVPDRADQEAPAEKVWA